VIGIGAKMTISAPILKDLQLSKFSDIWTIDKTHNKFLAHQLKMRFKLLNFARKLFLMLLKKTPPPPPLWKIYLYEKNLFILHYKYPDNLYLTIFIKNS
jgi:hypothetical protein